MQRLGLCCLFRKVPVAFRTTTASYIGRCTDRGEPILQFLSEIISENVKNLLSAVICCSEQRIGSFRIGSRLFPLYTHPEFGYQLDDLPGRIEILKGLRLVKEAAEARSIRLTFHPDQFVVLNSPFSEVVVKSIQELEYHGFMARLVGADVINIHGGGGYGDKKAALVRLVENCARLSTGVRERLTLENDDIVYTPRELLPVCRMLQIPLVYDVHHHRCLQDGLTIEQATDEACTTWQREPLFHISSPKGGWRSSNSRLHDDYIDPLDIPACWKGIDPLTIDIEAKAKEEAVLLLRSHLLKQGWKL